MNLIIDTGCANVSSVKFAVERLGYPVTVSSDLEAIKKADKLILPGVGTALEAMRNLEERKLVEAVQNATQPILGICLGMQLLAKGSEEGNKSGDEANNIPTLGIVDGQIQAMPVSGNLRMPHMGWDQVTPQEGHPLFKDIRAGSYFYFVHSFALPVGESTIASCDYGQPFTAAVGKDNFYGVQFHPERSGKAGAQLIKNFLEL